MNRVLNRANKRVSLGGAAALLIVVALFGQLLGFFRNRLVSTNFTVVDPGSSDAFFAAFLIPDFFFYTIAAGALGVAFMPFLSDHLARGDRKGVWELVTSLLNMLAIVMLVVGVIIFLFAEPIMSTLFPRLSGEHLHQAVMIMRFIAFNPLLFTLSGVLTSVQQTFGRFFFFAIAPLFYNLSIMISALIFSIAPHRVGGPGHLGITGLGIGALIGAIFQLLISCLGLVGLKFHWRPRILWRSRDFHTILRQLPPRSIDQGIDQINSIVETNRASLLGAGPISYYNYALILHNVPIMLFGTSIATAAFPRLTARLSQNRPDLFRKDFLSILRTMIWISLPVIVICFFCRAYLARLLFGKVAQPIALIFGYLTAAIFFRIIYSIMSRYFYAQKDTKTPLLVSIFAIALNIFLAVNLAKPQAYGIAGLAMAQSFVAASEVAILLTVMLFRDHRLLNMAFWGGVARILSVTGFSVLAAFVMLSIFPLRVADVGFLILGAKLGSITLVTLLVHVAVSSLFELEEAAPIVAKIKQIVLWPVKIE
ncbi:MAG TPA: lipid II flippase MurJ [Candidatus Limnocylindrales bacterium]|nr:lipid II flippase MurJ [Candidatus Limnocylindrales bacterium]